MIGFAVTQHSEIVEAATAIKTRINKQRFSRIAKAQKKWCSEQQEPGKNFYAFHPDLCLCSHWRKQDLCMAESENLHNGSFWSAIKCVVATMSSPSFRTTPQMEHSVLPGNIKAIECRLRVVTVVISYPGVVRELSRRGWRRRSCGSPLRVTALLRRWLVWSQTQSPTPWGSG
jgi:hypothetical protein